MEKWIQHEKLRGVYRNFPNFHCVIKAANQELHITKKFCVSVVISNQLEQGVIRVEEEAYI